LARKYLISYCLACDEEFLTANNKTGKKFRFCPFCGDDVDVKHDRVITLDKPLHRHRAWTKEEDQTLIYGRKNNVPYKEISESLGEHRTPKACRERIVVLRKEGVFEKSKGRSSFYEYKGKRYTIKELSEIYGVHPTTLYKRIYDGMSVDEAVKKPIKKTGRYNPKYYKNRRVVK